MQLKSDATTWGSLAKLFHWTIVLLIIVQGTVGLIMVGLPRKPNIIPIYSFHKSVGITILLLAVLRLSWRLFDRRPTEHPSIRPWQALAARAGHASLYALLFAVPLSGWWFDSVSALRPLYWFGLVEVPHLTGPDKSLKDLASTTHEVLFWLLVAVAVGHAAMALIHQFVKRDSTLARMLPGGRGLAAVPTVAISETIPEETIPEILESNHVQTTSSSAPGPDPVDPDLVRRDGA